MTQIISQKRRGRQKKIPIEQLQKDHLTGPAQQPVDEIVKELKEDQVIVFKDIPKHEKITFRNQRDPGHPLDFHYSSATHPYKQYKLMDGKEYELAYEVIKNLENCKEQIHKYRRNSDGLPEIYIAGYKSHFACERA